MVYGKQAGLASFGAQGNNLQLCSEVARRETMLQGLDVNLGLCVAGKFRQGEG